MPETKKPRTRRAKPLPGAPTPDAPSPTPSDAEAGAAPVREPGNPAPIGDNKPPADVAFAAHVEDLYVEASNWLDGEPICNAEQAEEVTKLKGLLAEAAKGADAARAEEKAPFLEAGRAVDAKWKPIVDKAKKALTVAQRALTPWLEAVEAENRRKAEEARREAEAAAERLREQAIASRERADLHDEDVREQLEQDTKAAEARARAAARETTVVRTEHGRASLRTVWLVEVEQRRELLMHYLTTKPDEVEAFIRSLAEKDVRAGARHLPGCRIWDERRAV